MPIRRNAAFVATVLAVAGPTGPSLAADFSEGGDFGGTYSYIGPGAGYPDYVEVAPVYPAPVYPSPAYAAPAYAAPAYAPGYAPVAPIVGQEIVETDIAPAPPPVAGYYSDPVEPYGDEYVEGPPPGYAAPPVGYAPPPMVDGYAGAPYDDVTVVAPDPGFAVGPDGY